jgi:hypothetical protein
MGAFSRRTAVGRALAVWRSELIADLGGEAHLSAQRRTLVELAARTHLILNHIDAFIVEQKTLVNKSKRSVFPVVAQRIALSESLAKYLALLGLDRVEQRRPALDGRGTNREQLERALQQIRNRAEGKDENSD